MMRGSHLNCGRFVRTLIRPMTNDTLQHGLSEMFFRCYRGTPLITSIGPKQIGRINEGFSTRKCMAIFARQPKKKWP